MNINQEVEQIKTKIADAFHKKLSRMGFGKKGIKDKHDKDEEYKKAQSIITSFQNEGMNYTQARQKYLDELTFTLFNRIAGLKVMETHTLKPEMITTRSEHGNKSFAHKAWLEQYPEKSNTTLQGLDAFLKDTFAEIGENIFLYNSEYPYDFLPEVHDLKDIIDMFNQKITEEQWQKDDIMGWMYEAYNKKSYKDFKESGDKIEYNKVSLSSQMYTPRWVVEFLVNNSLGKYWLEINPESRIKDKHDIANAPDEQVLEYKKVEEIKLADIACGSGNFLLYSFDLLYEIYEEEGYAKDKIPNLILKNNLYGIDLDERAVQIARLQLYIKAMRKSRSAKVDKINVVSADFHLPDFEEVKHNFFEKIEFDNNLYDFTERIWEQLQQAHKFGSLITIKEDLEKYISKQKKEDTLGLFDGYHSAEELEKYLLNKLHEIFKINAEENVSTKFFKHQSQDAIKFAEIMLMGFDIAVTNPPYTDSSNYGKKLKKFISNNYKKPYSFYPNLYACFLKKNADFIDEQGKIGMIHPLTFMYIKTYEDMRKFILNNYHINLMIELGLGGVFYDTTVNVDVSAYVLEIDNYSSKTFFMNLQPYKGHLNKKDIFAEAYKNFIQCSEDQHNYIIRQNKLKIIDGYPFIYWISDSFRKKFEEEQLDDILDIRTGMQTGNNLRFLRYWWEVNQNKISKNYKFDKKKWVPYQKGGGYNKWFGNNWLIIPWGDEAQELQNFKRSSISNELYFFKEGITYSATSSKGLSYRKLDPNNIFDIKGSCLFLREDYRNLHYIIGLLNSPVPSFILKSLNNTVETQVGDNKRIPFIKPDKNLEIIIMELSKKNVEIKKHQNQFSIIEKEFQQNPLDYSWEKNITNPAKRLISYIDYKYNQDTQILLNEAVIDEKIFEVYDLTESDREMVLEKEGLPAGMYPVFGEDIDKFLKNNQENIHQDVEHYLRSLEVIEDQDKDEFVQQVEKLYQKNKSVEYISKEIKLNPISVWSIIEDFNDYPAQKAYKVSSEFILDIVRDILNEDDDGIAVINEYAEEAPLDERIKQKLYEKGFSDGDIHKLQTMLKNDIKSYLLQHFFQDECKWLNLFRFLPKTPFIWHITSGEEHGFDAFTIIYKWKRDSVYKLKSFYLYKRRTSLTNELINLANDITAEAEKKKDRIRKQLEEIKGFEERLDKLIDSGYKPKLDDGVGRNIAPLQNFNLISEQVLTKGQLKKFLNADW